MVAITVRSVPNEVPDEPASQAANAGKSLEEYLCDVLRQTAEPPLDEWLRCVRTRVKASKVRTIRTALPRRFARIAMTLTVDAVFLVSLLTDGGLRVNGHRGG